MLLEAYFDESGIHDGAEVCVVGGFYGTQKAWRKFEREWSKVIGDYPELAEYGFHAKVFFRRDKGKRVGPYADWDDPKASKFLDRLVQVVMRNRVFPIGYGIIVRDFLALPLRMREWFSGAKFTIGGKRISSGSPKRAYYLPFQFCVVECAKTSGANQENKVHFYAGLDRTFHEYASDLYEYLLGDLRLPDWYRSALGGISYPLAKDTPGLQAADLLIYRLYRYGREQIAAGQNVKMPPLLSRILKNRKPQQRFALLNTKELLRIESGAKKIYPALKNVMGPKWNI